MDSLRRYIPDGARDILFDDCRCKVRVIERLRKLYRSKGFFEIISPTLEFYDVFCDDNMPMSQDKMYKLFDNRGRILVLRPDMTIPIARIAATKLKDIGHPIRVCYCGNIFRVNEIFNGKDSEITQSGVEILGVENEKADLEAIITAIEALIEAGIQGFQIELGQAEFFKGLVEDTEIGGDEMERLKELVENKNFTALKDFVESREDKIGRKNAYAIKSLPELFGGMEVLDRAQSITSNKRALQAVEGIRGICEKLNRIGLGRYISIDLGLIQHIHYYTGIIFRGYMNEVGCNILSGGRYDNLTARYGKPMAAVGFAIDVDSITVALDRQIPAGCSGKKSMLLHYDDKNMDAAYRLSNSLKKGGCTVEWSLYQDRAAAVDYGRSRGFEYICCVVDGDKVEVIDTHDNNIFVMDADSFKDSL